MPGRHGRGAVVETRAAAVAAVGVTAPHRNIELKSRLANPPAARAAAIQLGATDAGVLEQIDTYFHCRTGRLKLRETVGQAAELIAYARPDHAEPRASDYHLIPVADPAALKHALALVLGVRVIVTKRRHLLLWQNVRIHLDEVDGLGTFCEFEAVLDERHPDEAAAHERLAVLAKALALNSADRIATSYSNLIESIHAAR